jgi:oligosaccharyltransferase complex subunit delta (ribophorin II)
LLVAKDGGKGKRPHQAFVVLQDEVSGLEAPFPLTVKENGKAVVDIVRLRHLLFTYP